MASCIPNNTMIRHKGNCPNTRIVKKISSKIYFDHQNNKSYPSLYAFTSDHYRQERPDRGVSNNVWTECEFFIDDTLKWECINNLRTNYNQVHV